MTTQTTPEMLQAMPVIDFAAVAQVEFNYDNSPRTLSFVFADGSVQAYKDGGRIRTNETAAKASEVFNALKSLLMGYAKSRNVAAVEGKKNVTMFYFAPLPAPKRFTDAQANLLRQIAAKTAQYAWDNPSMSDDELADSFTGVYLDRPKKPTIAKLVECGFVAPANDKQIGEYDGQLTYSPTVKLTAAAQAWIAANMPDYTRKALFAAWDKQAAQNDARDDAMAEYRRRFTRQFVSDLEGTASFAVQDVTARCTYAPEGGELSQAKFAIFAKGVQVAEITWQRLTPFKRLTEGESVVYGWELALTGKKGYTSGREEYGNATLAVGNLAQTLLVLQFAESIMQALQAAKPNENRVW